MNWLKFTWKVLFLTFLFYVNFGFWMLTRPTPISCVHDRNIFIDLTPPVSIKGLKPTGFNSNLPLSIQAHHFMFMPTSFNSSFGTHEFQFQPWNPPVLNSALKPTSSTQHNYFFVPVILIPWNYFCHSFECPGIPLLIP